MRAWRTDNYGFPKITSSNANITFYTRVEYDDGSDDDRDG